MADQYSMGVQQGFGQFYQPAGGDQTNQFVGFPLSQASQMASGAGLAGPHMLGPQSFGFEAQGRPGGYADPTGMGMGPNPAMLQAGMGGGEFGPFGQFPGDMSGMVGGQMGGPFMQDPSMMGPRGMFNNNRGMRSAPQRGGANKFSGAPQRNVNLPSVTNPEGLRDDTVFISGLPQNVDHDMIKKEFGAIGKIKMNVKTSMPMVWIFKEKGIPRGDGLVTFEDQSCVAAAIEHFTKNDFRGQKVTVKQATNAQRPVIIPPSNGAGSNNGAGMMMAGPGMMGSFDDGMMGRRGMMGGRGGGPMMGRGGLSMDSKRTGDWTCPDCQNVNFAWREACNRCGSNTHQAGMMMDPSMMMMGQGPKSMMGVNPGPMGRGGMSPFRGGSMGPMRGGHRGPNPGGMPFQGAGMNRGVPAGPGSAMMMLTPQPGGGAGCPPNMGRGGGPLRALGAAGGPGARARPAPY